MKYLIGLMVLTQPNLVLASWQSDEKFHQLLIEIIFLTAIPLTIFIFSRRRRIRRVYLTFIGLTSILLYWIIFQWMAAHWLLRLRFSEDPPIEPYVLFLKKFGLCILAAVLIYFLFGLFAKISVRWLRTPLYIFTILISVFLSFLYIAIGLPPFYVKGVLIKGPMSEVVRAIENYEIDCGHYPAQEAGLNVLVIQDSSCSQWAGPYIESEKLLDHWKRPYIYEQRGKSFRVTTLGLLGKVLPPSKDKRIMGYSREGWSENATYDSAESAFTVRGW